MALTTHPQSLARNLGVLSIGLGLTQLLAPRWFSRTIGVPGTGGSSTTVRLVGIRELMAGAGLLGGPPTPFLWMRVAGDAMDLALLSQAARNPLADRDRTGAAIASTLGITAVDVLASVGATGQDGTGLLGAKPARAAITIGLPPAEVYAFWRGLEHLPRFMRHLEDVTVLDDRRSRWTATAPFGTHVSWEAEIIADEPGRRLAWRALPGSTVRHEGEVRFVPAPGDRGTEVHVEITYEPPAGAIGVGVAKLLGEEPETQMKEDLRRLKQILETGVVVRSEATFGERRLKQAPAQPRPSAPPPIVAPEPERTLAEVSA